MSRSLPVEKVADVFEIARLVADTVQKGLKILTLEEGGWPLEKWSERSGGTLAIIDADEMHVSVQSINGPPKDWQGQTAKFAIEKARRALSTGYNSVVTRDPDTEKYSGAVLFEYICAVSGEIRVGAIAFSGWPEWADHLFVNELAFMSEHLMVKFQANVSQVAIVFPGVHRHPVHAGFVKANKQAA